MLKLSALLFLFLIVFWQLKLLKWNDLKNLIVPSFLPVFLMVCLLPLNYFLEWKKWSLILKRLEVKTTKSLEIQSFFAGLLTAILTPNMQGNFLGRIYYFPRKQRVAITLLTLWSNYIQFCVAVLFGVISIWAIGSDSYLTLSFEIKIGLLLLVLISFFPFLFGSKILPLFKRFKSVRRIQGLLTNHRTFSLQLLFFSSARYLVFSIQFFLVLYAFGGSFSFVSLFLVWQIYLWTTFAPSLILGKIVIRETIAVWVLAGIGIGSWNIIFASLFVWFINLILPALFGLMVCKKRAI